MALHAREPDFHLIQPGEIGGREVQFYLRVGIQEFGDFPRFVSGEIVDDDMNFLLRFAKADHLAKKVDKLIAGVTLRRLSVHFSRLNVQRRVEG